MARTSDPSIVLACAPGFFAQWQTEIETKNREREKSNRMIRIWFILSKPSSTSSTRYVLMCKLDNKIRTCLLALYGTYQHHNLIPESLFLHPRFTAFTLDLITFLSDEAATRGLAGVGLHIIAENTKQGPTEAVYIGTKDPLCQQRERVRCQGTDPQQRRSQRGHSTTGTSDPNRQRWNGDSSFQHRYTVSEQVHRLAADRLSNLPHTQLVVILLSL